MVIMSGGIRIDEKLPVMISQGGCPYWRDAVRY